MSDNDRIEFEPIPGEKDGSMTCLTIYLPGSFFGKDGYAVFLGGCGHGRADTLNAVEKLTDEEIAYRIKQAKATIDHYTAQLAKFGLVEKKDRR